MRKYLPDKDFFLGREPPDLPGYKIVQHKGSGNNAHVFRAYSDELRHDIAVKIIPRENLRPNWKQEFLKANILRSRMVVKFFNINEWQDKDNMIDCVVLLSDYVSGKTLHEHLKQNKRKVLIDFIVGFLEEVFNLFHEMDERGFQHGDLHSGNILVEDQPSTLIGPQYIFRITDFGVASATDEESVKDDYEQLAFILKECLENIDYQAAGALERFTFNVLNDHFLAKHLIERDTTRDPYARRPQKLFERLKAISSEFEDTQTGSTFKELTDPFEYLSCEQLGESHSLLKVLYSNRFLGLSDIEQRNNLVLTGPRGCGKSTVFKSLSLRHRVLVNDDNPDHIKYIGIYYRCDDLYFAFPRYNLPNRQEAYDIPLHFITSTLLSELLDSIQMWAQRHYKREFKEKEEYVSRALWEMPGLKRPQEPGIDNFSALSAWLQKERLRAAEKQRFVNDPKQSFGRYFGPDVLIKACNKVIEMLPFVKDRPFFFLIDDYSAPKITIDLQENLNRLLMQRSSSCFFKLSTESPVSYALSDIDKKVYVERREFSLLNLGLVYIHGDLKEKLQFIQDVFARRLQAIENYPVHDLDTLIGTYSGPAYNEVARAIRSSKKVEIWGKQALCSLCSGDIHYVIDLVRQMVSKVGGRDGLAKINSFPRISPPGQTKAIREQAGNFLRSLRILPKGDHLVEVVTAFGIVAHAYLKFRDSKNVKGKPPWQAHRIEPYEQLVLSDEAQRIYDELLRYSVFIEDVRGKSRRGKVVPRLYLRRFLIPHFNLTFSTRDSIELEVNEIEDLLLRPRQFEKKHLLRKKLVDDQQLLPGFEWGEDR